MAVKTRLEKAAHNSLNGLRLQCLSSNILQKKNVSDLYNATVVAKGYHSCQHPLISAF